jgi:hypothetical protein
MVLRERYRLIQNASQLQFLNAVFHQQFPSFLAHDRSGDGTTETPNGVDHRGSASVSLLNAIDDCN